MNASSPPHEEPATSQGSLSLAIPRRADWEPGFRALASFLTQETGVRIAVVAEKDFDAVRTAIVGGRASLGILTSTAYIRAKEEDPGLRYLATARAPEGQEAPRASYHGEIVVRRDSSLHALGDLVGKPFAFVSLSSSSGYKYPRAFLKSQGIDPARDLGNVMFMGDHPYVTDVVAAGIAAGGATWEGNLAKAVVKHGDIFRSLGRYGPLVNHAFVAGPSVAAPLSAEIAEALCRIPESVRATAGFPYAGFEILSDASYDAARAVDALDRQESAGSS